jgi:hypothetical protein
VVPAGARLLPIAPATAPAPAAVEPDPTPTEAPPVVPTGARLLPVRCAVSPAETDETAPAEPAPAIPAPRPPLVPAGARLLPVVAATVPAETAPQTAQTAQPAVEPADREVLVDALAGNGHGNGNGHAAAGPAIAPVDPRLLGHLARVMAAHQDWAITIGLPGRHPEALTYAKIKTAIGGNGQQTAADIRTALLMLRANPEAAAAHVKAHAPTDDQAATAAA